MVALDYGRRRIGVAATDPLRTISAPHSAVANQDPPTEPPTALLDLLRDLEPALVLVGIPVNMDGSEGDMAAETRRFAARLATLTDLPIEPHDERLTSYKADELMQEMTLPRRRRREKGIRDMLAATLLLRDFMAES